MASVRSFLEAPDGTREELMRATYLALCDHGYASLTIQRIADEFPKSKSLIYHHYDGKDELLLDFLEFMLEQFEDTVPSETVDDRLQAVFDHVFATPLSAERREFSRAMVELRAQAAHDERYRDHFTRSDRFFRDHLASIIEEGIDDGQFRPVDPTATATFLQTVFEGVRTSRVTSSEDVTETVRAQLETYVDTLVREDP